MACAAVPIASCPLPRRVLGKPHYLARARPCCSHSLLKLALLLALALLCVFTPTCGAQGQDTAPGRLVRRDGGRFALPDGSVFTVVGANCYFLAYSSAAEAGSFEHRWVDEVLDEGESLGLNVVRVWAFHDEVPGPYTTRHSNLHSTRLHQPLHPQP